MTKPNQENVALPLPLLKAVIGALRSYLYRTEPGNLDEAKRQWGRLCLLIENPANPPARVLVPRWRGDETPPAPTLRVYTIPELDG